MKTKCVVRSVAGQGICSAILGGLTLVLLSLAGPASAQTKSDVAISLVAQKVSVGQDGKEILRPADRAFPGEVVQYDARYRNQAQKPVRALEPTLPIPRGLEYLPDSAKPAPSQASTDGKTFAPLPLMRKVTKADGSVVDQPVPASEYRALRWAMGDLEAGKTVTVTARARLSGLAAN
jgi:hypothetical protein